MNENEVGSSLEAGTRDQPLRTSSWEATLDAVCVQTDKSLIWTRLQIEEPPQKNSCMEKIVNN